MITLNYRDSKPIYEQIKDAIRRLILTGIMVEDEKLPSVRELAQQLSINPNTIQRAYRELETEGCIYSVAGKGSFVAKAASLTDERRVQLLHALDAALMDLKELGVSKDEICSYVTDFLKGGDET